MASSISNSPIVEASKPQAGPLPSKRGEIGFQEGVHTEAVVERDEVVPDLPARHPAETYHSSASGSGTSSERLTDPTPNGSTSSVTLTTSSSKKTKQIFRFLISEKVSSYRGFRLTTLLIFILQILFLGATITGWIFASKLLSHTTTSSNQKSTFGGMSVIFAHISFGVATIAQLLFLERRIFRMRAERFNHLHPGEVLPRYRDDSQGIVAASSWLGPWNRPPLPTYAAALRQSNAGTGDVEDAAIVTLPPPAYGNTRGSRLLLSNVMNPQRERERRISYISRDEEWEEVQNADRARRLEETLAQLEAEGNVTGHVRG